jgi:hypothetical protein
MKIKMVGDRGCFNQEVECDNRTWAAGEITAVPLTIHPVRAMQGEFMLYVGLFENERPIELGMKNGEDGFYPVGTVTVE